MQKFYFNECVPVDGTKELVLSQFADSLREFNCLLQQKMGIDRSVISEKLPSKIRFGATSTLQDLIESLENNDLKNLAFALFIKHPIHHHFELPNELADKLLESNFTTSVAGNVFDATNLAITHHNKGFLFTVATHTNLHQNILNCISGDQNITLAIDSLYGEENNTEYIAERVKLAESLLKDNWNQLLDVLGPTIYTTAFKREFDGLREVEQQSIIDAFRQARNRNLASPFFPDTKLIKDVTPQNPKKAVFELRIYAPTAVRVYFNEDGGNVYVAKLQKKSSPDQSYEIKQSDLLINKLMTTGA